LKLCVERHAPSPRACSPCNGKRIRADEFSFVLAWIQVIVRFLNSS
jgi:hypothetical protein